MKMNKDWGGKGEGEKGYRGEEEGFPRAFWRRFTPRVVAMRYGIYRIPCLSSNYLVLSITLCVGSLGVA